MFYLVLKDPRSSNVLVLGYREFDELLKAREESRKTHVSWYKEMYYEKNNKQYHLEVIEQIEDVPLAY